MMRVSYTPLKVIPTQPVFAFSMTYHGFYLRASLTQGLLSTKRISTSMDLLAWYHHRCTTHWIMTTIALVYPHPRIPLTCPLRYLI
jgi:hypothetical protein